MELVHGANWMRTSIPRFSQLIEPLHKQLEAQYIIHNNRKITCQKSPSLGMG